MASFNKHDENLAGETGSEALLRRAAFVAFAGLCGLGLVALIAIVFEAFHH